MRIQILHEQFLAPFDRFKDEEFCEKNADAFAKLNQFLEDDRSLCLMRKRIP